MTAIIAVIPSFCFSQQLYLVSPDIDNITLPPTRLAPIPGIVTVNPDNTTVDENLHHFFFLANSTLAGPAVLCTLDETTGNVLSSPTCPSNISNGKISGMHFDNSTSTLYGICTIGWGTLEISSTLVWIDPSTGIVHPIPGTENRTLCCAPTAFDQNDHLYLATGALDSLIKSDVTTGVTNAINLKLSYGNIIYFNHGSTLLGLAKSQPVGSPVTVETLYHIDPYSGAQTLIQSLDDGVHGTPNGTSNNTGTVGIDDGPGRYFFVSKAEKDTNDCAKNQFFFVIDATSGSILSQHFFPYGSDPTQTQDELMLGFSYDNKLGKCYALNWHLPDDPPKPQFTITSSANLICPGDTVNFTVQRGANALLPTYQWLVNGMLQGTDSVFSDQTFRDNDTVACVLTTNLPCSINGLDTQIVVMHYKPLTTSSLTISATGSTICTGSTVFFTADPVNGGTSPSYQWLVNGKPLSYHGRIIRMNSLDNGDTISCILQSSACSLPVHSTDSVVMTVYPTPQLSMPPDTVIQPGQSVDLAPDVTGADPDQYQWSPSGGLNLTTSPQVDASPQATTVYQLIATTDKGCADTGKTTVTVYYPLHMPNAFTPNNDGRNDLFRIPPAAPQQIRGFAVYDRWGRMVFHTTNTEGGWDGTLNGQPQPAGTYTWEIEYNDPFTQKISSAHGTVMLIR